MPGGNYLPVSQRIWASCFNNVLEHEVKVAALNCSAAVVGVQSTVGAAKLFTCSGTIVDCKGDGGSDTYTSVILTAASLVKDPSRLVVAPNIKVHVRVHGGNYYDGEVAMVDFHYNIAIIKIRSNIPLISAKLRALNDWSPIVCDFRAMPLRCHHVAEIFNLRIEDKVIALARSYAEEVLMVQPGSFSARCCEWDCDELLMATCKVYHAYIGGPIINLCGEVIGLNLGYDGDAPFLPMNIALRCLEYMRTGREVHRPKYGMTVANLYLAKLAALDRIVRRFPDVCGGVVVEKVEEGSAADRAGFRPGDIIIQCAGDTIKCSVEFFEKMWDKAGETVEITVIRLDGTHSKLNLAIEDVNCGKYNSWLIPKLRRHSKNI